ncbi:MAG TPA: thiamine-phosphate kinase [Lacipirellulaceae bacterium]|jgi:thiamine-monophosphate kinase|nr:thiamine-phosphate kinase [Lacipirellulaceae bacterium]
MELEFIQWLREHVPAEPRAKLGLSDDAALISLAGRDQVVVTTDLLTDAVDFQLGMHEPQRIGRQALAANLSDLAAMAAKPVAAFISLALPHRGGAGLTALQLAINLYEGLLPLAQEFDLAIAGGDTNTYDGPLALSVTALGTTTARGPLTRSGGKPGDWLLVTGSLGGSILGHMLDFTPRVKEAILLNKEYDLHAGIDISDGLALDASRLAKASGCGANLFIDRIPVSRDATRLAEQEKATDIAAAGLHHALSDGQDFELLLAVAPDIAQRILRDHAIECPITHVGELIADSGLWQQSSDKPRTRLEATGWRHT